MLPNDYSGGTTPSPFFWAGWQSGLLQLILNQPESPGFRGFKSHPSRSTPKATHLPQSTTFRFFWVARRFWRVRPLWQWLQVGNKADRSELNIIIPLNELLVGQSSEAVEANYFIGEVSRDYALPNGIWHVKANSVCPVAYLAYLA